MKKRLSILCASLVLTFAFSITCFAADSPTGDVIEPTTQAPTTQAATEAQTTTSGSYHLTVEGHAASKNGTTKVPGGSISSSSDTITPGEEITLTATADDGYSFSNWVINGKYKIVSGSLESGTITIIPLEDIDVDAIFTEDENGEEATTGSANTSLTSPKTGSPIGGAFVIVLAAAGLVLVATKEYSKAD